MGAANHVGRVGGLAVSLGIGTAILTGHGVATAVADADGPGADTSTAPAKVVKAGPKKPQLRDVLRGSPAKDGAGAKDQPSTRKTKPARSDRSFAEAAKDALARHGVPADKGVLRASADRGRALTDHGAALERAAKAVSSGLTAAQAASAQTVQTIQTAVDDVLRQSATNSPSAPPADTPLSWSLLAAARKEFTIGEPRPLSLAGPNALSSTQSSLVTAAPTIEYAPDPAVADGVITWLNPDAAPTSSRGFTLTYTVIGDPSNGGKIGLNSANGSFTFLPYKTWGDTQNPSGSESFRILVAENTPFNQALEGIPLVGSLVQPVLVQIYQVPILSDVLAPLIGYAVITPVNVDLDDPTVNPGGNPIAYTVMVTSWDNTQISTNYFPSSGNTGEQAPTILYGPGLGGAGATNPGESMVSMLRENGYNVVTWDPRGEHASGGTLQLDNPQFEGRDVSAIISYLANQPTTRFDSTDTDGTDPLIGMVGPSYGGGIQLVAAANDHRIDAIAPEIAWNSLNDSLYPNGAFKTAYSALLLLGLVTTGATINNEIYGGILTGALLGILTEEQQALLISSGPGASVTSIEAPTLLIQGTVDVLFPLQQAVLNARMLTLTEDGRVTPAITKMIWFCGGHGSCLEGQGNPAADQEWVQGEVLTWMNTYVRDESTTPPEEQFEWTDQNGVRYSSTLMPTVDDFFGAPLTTSWNNSDTLFIVPLIGGSGPQSAVSFPYSLGDASVAANAINIPIANPVGSAGNPTGTTHVVGAPTMTFTYSGVGTSRVVYAQIVDKKTGLVVGNIVTPIPVTLDGRSHEVTVPVPLNDIAYTMDADSELELQIVGSATPFLNFTQFGVLNVSDVTLTLPTAAEANVDGVSNREVVRESVAV